jgi:RNA polymerase sigma-70 factor (ECF subfamily)
MDAIKELGAGPARQDPAPRETICTAHSPFPLSAEQVYQDYAPHVFNTARRMVSNDSDAEDVTQDVLLKVVRKLPTFRGDSAFPTWLHRVTVNTALSHRRRQAVQQEHGLGYSRDVFGEDEPLVESAPGKTPEPATEILHHEMRQLIEQAIASLPEMYRTVFVLADIEGWSNADIAAHLHLTLPAVKSRLHRARLLMRDALAPHFNEELPGCDAGSG